MSYYENMKQALEAIRNIDGSSAGVVLETTKLLREELAEIQNNPLLSPEGKRKQEEAVRKEFGEAFLKQALKLRKDYDSAVVSASNNAHRLLNEEPAKPHGDYIKTFDKEFHELKTNLLLSTSQESSLQQLQAFVDKQDKPYFFNSILKSFPDLIQDVLKASGKSESTKISLRGLYDHVKTNSMTPEQREAAQVYESIGTRFGAAIFKQGIEMDAIKRELGANIAQYANKPDYYKFSEPKATVID